MNENLNKDVWKSMENSWTKDLQAGKRYIKRPVNAQPEQITHKKPPPGKPCWMSVTDELKREKIRLSSRSRTSAVTVENNYLSSTQAVEFDNELSDCRKSGGDCYKVIDKWKKVSDEQSAIVDERLENHPLTAVGWDKEVALGGIGMTRRLAWLGSIGADVMSSEEARIYVQHWNGEDLAKIDVNSPQWMKYAVFVSDPENQAMLASAGLLARDVTRAAVSFMSLNTATATVKASEAGM